MPRNVSNVELAHLSQAGRATYEDGAPIKRAGQPPPAPAPAPDSSAAVVRGMETVALAIMQANRQNTDALSQLVADMTSGAQQPEVLGARVAELIASIKALAKVEYEFIPVRDEQTKLITSARLRPVTQESGNAKRDAGQQPQRTAAGAGPNTAGGQGARNGAGRLYRPA